MQVIFPHYTSRFYLPMDRPFVLSVHSYSIYRIISVISSDFSHFISLMKFRISHRNSTIVIFKVCLYLSYFVSQGLFETCSDITVVAANGGFPAPCFVLILLRFPVLVFPFSLFGGDFPGSVLTIGHNSMELKKMPECILFYVA